MTPPSGNGTFRRQAFGSYDRVHSIRANAELDPRPLGVESLTQFRPEGGPRPERGLAPVPVQHLDEPTHVGALELVGG